MIDIASASVDNDTLTSGTINTGDIVPSTPYEQQSNTSAEQAGDSIDLGGATVLRSTPVFNDSFLGNVTESPDYAMQSNVSTEQTSPLRDTSSEYVDNVTSDVSTTSDISNVSYVPLTDTFPNITEQVSDATDVRSITTEVSGPSAEIMNSTTASQYQQVTEKQTTPTYLSTASVVTESTTPTVTSTVKIENTSTTESMSSPTGSPYRVLTPASTTEDGGLVESITKIQDPVASTTPEVRIAATTPSSRVDIVMSTERVVDISTKPYKVVDEKNIDEYLVTKPRVSTSVDPITVDKDNIDKYLTTKQRGLTPSPATVDFDFPPPPPPPPPPYQIFGGGESQGNSGSVVGIFEANSRRNELNTAFQPRAKPFFPDGFKEVSPTLNALASRNKQSSPEFGGEKCKCSQ